MWVPFGDSSFGFCQRKVSVLLYLSLLPLWNCMTVSLLRFSRLRLEITVSVGGNLITPCEILERFKFGVLPWPPRTRIENGRGKGVPKRCRPGINLQDVVQSIVLSNSMRKYSDLSWPLPTLSYSEEKKPTRSQYCDLDLRRQGSDLSVPSCGKSVWSRHLRVPWCFVRLSCMEGIVILGVRIGSGGC